MHSERVRGQGFRARKVSGNMEWAIWEVSVQPNPLPTPSTVPAGGRLSLPSTDAILECGTCQLRGPWSWGPTSCREAQGLGSRSRAWENRSSKPPERFPPAAEKRGLQGHSRGLNIGTLGGGSDSCLPQGAFQFLLVGVGMGFSEWCL